MCPASVDKGLRLRLSGSLTIVALAGLSALAISACGTVKSPASGATVETAVPRTTSYNQPVATAERSSVSSFDPGEPVVVGDGRNSVTPRGENQTGLDATDSLCAGMVADLNNSITTTLAELRSSGMPASMMPSRAEIQDMLDDGLAANGCSGF
jgi:hypothetical protein